MRLALPLALLSAALVSAAEPTPAEVFEKRIVPIFKSPNASSCVQCHLAGVDLKDYILPDAEKTFRSLRDQGLIDLAAPEKSKIVRLIEMGTGGPKPANAVHDKNRTAEREAFLAWIAACAADPKLKDAPKLDAKEVAAPPRPAEVIRHARKDRLLASFENNVWAWRFRCMSCHTEGTPQSDKLVKEHGPQVAWFKKAGAEATMDYLLASKLIDAEKPEQSVLLRKPLGEKHGGGIKFVVGDDGYKGFRSWIEDITAIRGDKYKTAKELPAATENVKFGTEAWFKLTETKPEWADKFLLVRVFAWDDKAKAWEKQPVAVSDRVVFGKGKTWQHTVTLLAAKGSDRAKAWQTGKPSLPEGKYLVRVYVDTDDKLKKDWKAELTDTDFAGEAEFRGRWREGSGAMTTVDARLVKK